MNHLVSHHHHHELRGDNVLHVVAVVSNPARYHSRYRLAREFIERMEAAKNVRLHVVEAAYGDRCHEISREGDEHLRVRTSSEIWIKENMINLGVRHLLPRDWKYLAWVDADVEFREPHWAQEAMHELQHFPVLQPWQHCADLGRTGSVLSTHASFGLTDQLGTRRRQHHHHGGYVYGHTGYAWACTRTFYERVGGLVDFCILGSADHHMALACVGEVDRTVHTKMIPSFFRRLHEWQARAQLASHGEVGYSTGRIEHHFHGPKARRYYKERWQILVDAGFDPDRDLQYDSQGVIHLVGNHRLEQAIRKYNRARHEDSIEDT